MRCRASRTKKRLSLLFARPAARAAVRARRPAACDLARRTQGGQDAVMPRSVIGVLVAFASRLAAEHGDRLVVNRPHSIQVNARNAQED